MSENIKKMKKETPLMSQFNKIKSKYPDAILLFRVGDFYETFGKDAIKTSKILDIILTNRSNGSSKIELAGFPYHSLDSHLPKLVKAGLRVAICDQLEDPKTTKKIVESDKIDVDELFNNASIEKGTKIARQCSACHDFSPNLNFCCLELLRREVRSEINVR